MGDVPDHTAGETDVAIDPGPGNQGAWAHFLAQYAKCGVVTEAAEAANISTPTVYRWKKQSERCRSEFADAKLCADDVLRTEARRRAVDGVREPVFYQGECCGHIQRYSDTLMGRLLQAHCEEHKQESTLNLKGDVNEPLVVQVDLKVDTAQSVAEILAEVIAPAEPEQ